MNDLIRLKNYKNVIYDFDLTIAKAEINWEGWHVGVEKIFVKYEPTFKQEIKLHTIVNEMIHKYGKEIRDELFSFHEQYEFQNCTGVVPNTDLINFIKNNPSIKHHILTSQARLLLMKLLKDLEIENLFDKIIARDDTYTIKPDPEGIKKIIATNEPISNYIMVGDSQADEDTAKAVGMDFEKVDVFGKVY